MYLVTRAFTKDLYSDRCLHSRTATVKILQNLFAAEVGVTIGMAVCVANVSMVEKDALWNNTSTSGAVLKAK